MIGAILQVSKGGRLLLAVLFALLLMAAAYVIGRHDMARQIETERAEQSAKTQREIREFQDESRKKTDDDLCRRLTGHDC